ncbi:CBF/Mak21 family-domain-containing protein [Pseudomassariella vexata]|uniref:CBF/Mak21 family-domain-containing protein n=1 Tax=Pseudomassariella vexata TaxID=1141098 RepID=A0A1Y2E4M5_9PEZI|nr:CBF/Mak21 family-domain-containing protein [Pseudomassariella vexata]ORY66501.1 CBF/Mak21 family-domain-containing protein [Pseudomassariella vexata]
MASFDGAALVKLTAKIDQKLSEKDISDKKKQKQAKSPQATPNLKRKQPEEKPDEKKVERPAKKNKKDRKPAQDDRNGKAKPPKPSAKPASSALLDEIKALGGDEKDLELVGDIDSEDETLGQQDGKRKADKGLAAELAKFASELGFEKVQPEEEDEEDEEEGEEEEEEEEWEEAASEEDEAEEEEKAADFIPKGKRKTIFEPRPDWHAVQLKALPEPTDDKVAPYMSAIASLKEYAKTLLEEDSAAYKATLSASSSHRFMSTIMSSGTVSDRTSALTLAIMESPVHSIRPLENLMALAAKRSRGQALSASAALVDLLGPGAILPSDRRLRQFSAQAGLVGTLQKFGVKSWSVDQAIPGKITKEHLILWAFEDWLKESYFKIIQSLEVWCDDEVEYSRSKSLDMVYALLKDKPEQESNLLRLLVNKLGDRERKIASRASYLLLQLLNVHPGMKAVVVRAVEQEIIFRPGQNIRPKYYAVNTLNQTILSNKEPQVADALLRIYFGMFVSLLKTGALGQVEGPSTDPKSAKSDKRKRRREAPPAKKGEESKKGDDSNQNDQGERESAEKLVAAILTGINRAVPFSQADQSTLESHLDTLFRITHSSNFNTSIQALMLIQQLSSTRHLVVERFYRTLYESLLDPRLATSSKQALYLNLLYRSLKSDVDVRRVKAFVKRMLQILNIHQPSFICGILYLILELGVAFPDLKTLLNDPEEHDEEVGDATDAPDEDTPMMDDSTTEPFKPKDAYDGRKRDPEYSNAHLSCLWELLPFLRHFHPSVDLYATSVLQGQKPAQKPELANHTLIHFLDKFVYRNPKANDGSKGASIMQPVAASGQGSVLVSGKPTAKSAMSVNTASFWNKKAAEVAVDDVFFHEYFSQIGKPGQIERATKAKAEEIDDDDSEAGEDEIWEALKSSRPEVNGDSDSDDLGSEFGELMGDDGSDASLDDDLNMGGDSDGSALDFSDASSLDFSDEDEDEEGGAATAETTDGKPESEQRKRKKMLKGLPTFASADDYAAMLEQEENGLEQ